VVKLAVCSPRVGSLRSVMLGSEMRYSQISKEIL
jgi:hypothetical protein